MIESKRLFGISSFCTHWLLNKCPMLAKTSDLKKMHLTHGDIIEIVSESTKANEREKTQIWWVVGIFVCHVTTAIDMCVISMTDSFWLIVVRFALNFWTSAKNEEKQKILRNAMSRWNCFSSKIKTNFLSKCCCCYAREREGEEAKLSWVTELLYIQRGRRVLVHN